MPKEEMINTKKRPNTDETSVHSCPLEYFTDDASKNTDISSIDCDANKLIWLDVSINEYELDDQYSVSQLRLVIDKIVTFKNESKCLAFINKSQTKNKLFVIVSGSLGQAFVPKINHLSQINSIYVFCGNKIKHEAWAMKYDKVKGVFNDITKLCASLEIDKQKHKENRIRQDVIELLSKKPSLFDELFNMKNFKYNDQQPKDDNKISVTSEDIPFSKEESCIPIKELERSDNIHASTTVTPVVHYKQQMAFSDTGVWPCVVVTHPERNIIFNHLDSVIGTVKHSLSIENCVQHIQDHREDPHLVILCNPVNIQHVLTLIDLHVPKVYIYCSNTRINEYYALSEKYSNIVSVLQQIETLTRLVIWDLSAHVVHIGNCYDSQNNKKMAQTRYEYAHRLQIIIETDLNNRIELIEYPSLSKLRD